MRYALKTLKKLADKFPTQVARGLHELVAEKYGGEMIMPPHLQSEPEELPVLPPRAPTALELRAGRDESLVSGRTRSMRE